MTTVVLDTNIVSYLMRGHRLAGLYRPHLKGHTLAISFMSVGELYEGAYRAGWGGQRLSRLRETIETYLVIPFSMAVCREWGAIRSERRTRTIAVDDAWIAATARTYGLPLVTHNPADFSDIDGLEVLQVTEGSSSSAS